MAIDLSALSTDLNKFGGAIIRKRVNEARFKEDMVVHRRVKQPIPLPKLSIVGGPRPYRTQRDSAGNGIEFTDRILTVRQSKWDFPDIDPEVYRNTYLAEVEDGRLDPNKIPFWKYIMDQIGKQYWAKINDEVVLDGSYNASGTATADIATGFGTLIDADTNIIPVATGAANSTNAVAKTEQVADAAPSWMKEEGFGPVIFCSYGHLENYRKNYRASFGEGFNKNEKGSYMIDGTNIELRARSWMGTSGRLILTSAKNLHFGVDSDDIEVHATPHLNLLELRVMMPIGLQYADSDAIVVNDQV